MLRDGEIRQVGSPVELYEHPDHLDVAEFMGYRNRLSGKVIEAQGDKITLDIGNAHISGTARVPLSVGQSAILAVRPDDVSTAEPSRSTIQAKVDTIEYRGRDFVGTASTDNAHELVFHAPANAELGSAITLAIDANRALVFPA